MTSGQTKAMLATILLAIFIVPTSISGIAVALSSIESETNASITLLQWVVTAFNLTFACSILAWGAVADIIGRKRAFMIGVLIYILASITSAYAKNILLLDIARGLAGIGGASIFASGTAILSTNFDGSARLRAFGLAGAAIGIGVALGPTISGFIIGGFGWHSIFMIHAIILCGVLLAIPFCIHEKKETIRANSKIDWIGMGLFILNMFLLIGIIVEIPQLNQYSLAILLVSLIASASIFILRERRHRNPMFDFSVLRNPLFLGWCLGAVVPFFGFFILLTYFPIYLALVLNNDARTIGLVMLFLALPIFLCPILAGKLVQRGVLAQSVLLGSLVCIILGDIWLNLVMENLSLFSMALPMFIIGAGTGLTAGLVDGQALMHVSHDKAGIAAGLLNTMRLGSETIAIALYGPVLIFMLHLTMHSGIQAYGITNIGLDHIVNQIAVGNLSTSTVPSVNINTFHTFLVQSYIQSFQWVLWFFTSICVVLSIVIIALLRPVNKLLS